MFYNFGILKEFLSQNRINGWNCCGPYASFDTKISQIGQCHILMSYAPFDVICVI